MNLEMYSENKMLLNTCTWFDPKWEKHSQSLVRRGGGYYQACAN